MASFARKYRSSADFAVGVVAVSCLAEGGAVGLSMFFLVQSYKTIVGGLPRTIRGNATLLLLFKGRIEANGGADVGGGAGGAAERIMRGAFSGW